MTNVTAVLRIVLVCMTAIAPIPLNRAAAQDAPAFEAVKSEVSVGKRHPHRIEACRHRTGAGIAGCHGRKGAA